MKNILAIIMMTSAFMAYGQKQVVSAYNANKAGKYADAATYIDEAITVEKAAVKEKTWRYRGEIYLNIAKDTSLVAAYPNALWTAKDAYLKARELDTKGNYEREIITGLGLVQTTAANQGINDYSSEVYDQAAGKFDLSAEIAGMFDVLDTMGIFNAALCYEKSNNVDLAVERYKTCGENGYQVPNVYLFVANLLRQNGRDEDALAELQSARALFPREQSLIIEELNIYLEAKDFERAENNLKLAAEGDPTNEILWFSLGSVYDNLEKDELAAEAADDAALVALALAPRRAHVHRRAQAEDEEEERDEQQAARHGRHGRERRRSLPCAAGGAARERAAAELTAAGCAAARRHRAQREN